MWTSFHFSILAHLFSHSPSTIVLHKCSVYVIKPIMVVDANNPNSTGSLES